MHLAPICHSKYLTRLPNRTSAHGLGPLRSILLYHIYSSITPVYPETLYLRPRKHHETIETVVSSTPSSKNIPVYQSARPKEPSNNYSPTPFSSSDISPDISLNSLVDRQDVPSIQDPQEDRLDAKETSWFPSCSDAVWVSPPPNRRRSPFRDR
jgi:hypothetical protein